MARIVFGADFVEENTVVFSLINANSPLVWDATMLGGARAYAEANQAVMMTPFILAGAMSPATVAATCAQTLAESLAGHGLRAARAAGRACRARLVRLARCRCSRARRRSGRPSLRSSSTSMASLARRLGVPFRSGGALTASKIPDAQAAYESANTMQPTMLGGVNFVLHAAGWLEGGLAMGYEKFVLDADQLGMWHAFCKGVDLSENGQALDAFLDERAGHALPRPPAHARELRDRLLPLPARGQLELRAVGIRGRARRRAACERASGRGHSRNTSSRRSTTRSRRSSPSGSNGRRRPSRTRTYDDGLARPRRLHPRYEVIPLAASRRPCSSTSRPR